MLKVKRLHTYVLQSFLPLFVMTFGICWFIVLMQFLWRYIDDMVGKGLDMVVLGEMLMYAALSLVPMALPLAILLASLMTFGNLGERFELLAMKSAGVSLVNIMRPLIVMILFVSVGTFFYQNQVMPVAQVKLYTLLYSMRMKSPELDIPVGSFYGEIKNYSVYVRGKDQTGLLKDLMIYDNTNGFNNATVIVADSGRLKTSADKLFLVLTLYNGHSFKNLKEQTSSVQSKEAVAYQRETFGMREILIEFDANFARTDESHFQNQYIGKNLKDLESSIDSMTLRADSMKTLNANSIYESSYHKSFATNRAKERREIQSQSGTSAVEKLTNPMKEPLTTSLVLNFDTIYAAETVQSRAGLLSRASSTIENVKSEYTFRTSTITTEDTRIRRHHTEWHNKFTICFACLVFFFIGAPLGAIIRKGGLGTPVVISVLLFIFYYVINNIGFKMARDGVWPAWQGMWLSSAVLTPLGLFLTYKAVNDSVILNADTYLNALKNLIGKRQGRKVEKKEVIIFNPDYDAVSTQLLSLISDCEGYLSSHKRWISYMSYWRQGGKDAVAERIAHQTEAIVEELENSDKILVLNKLMDYPVIGGANQLKADWDKRIYMAIAIFLPLGIPVYLLAIYQRKLLRHDIKTVLRTSHELNEMINENKDSDNE